MSASTIAEILAKAAPAATLLVGRDAERYDIGGLRPSVAALVTTPDDAAAVLSAADEHGWAVASMGGGTRLQAGNPPHRLDVVLDVGGMSRIVDYQPDDLTLTVEAGVALGRLHALLAARGQMLPLQVLHPDRATVGGALACNDSGPMRLRYGTARDLVIGMQFALPGTGLARTGGRVVKNVAGYDLAKLHIGALGTLGVITEVTFKLWPAPAALATVSGAFDSFERACSVASKLVAGQLFPTAVEVRYPVSFGNTVGGQNEIDMGQWGVHVLCGGSRAAVERQRLEARRLLVTSGATSGEETELAPLRGALPAVHVRQHTAGSSAFTLTCSVFPSQTELAVATLVKAGKAAALVPVEFRVQPGAGLAIATWNLSGGDETASTDGAGRAARIIEDVRAALRPIGGVVTVEPGAVAARSGLDAWGLSGPDIALMRRIKSTYDPHGTLNPGRFVDGI